VQVQDVAAEIDLAAERHRLDGGEHGGEGAEGGPRRDAYLRGAGRVVSARCVSGWSCRGRRRWVFHRPRPLSWRILAAGLLMSGVAALMSSRALTIRKPHQISVNGMSTHSDRERWRWLFAVGGRPHGPTVCQTILTHHVSAGQSGCSGDRIRFLDAPGGAPLSSARQYFRS
jgi:hypothetical protein